jgi:hypothetical protein
MRRLVPLLLLAALSGPATAERYPRDAGALDVRAYGAKGDGQTDDTEAILTALTASGEDTGPAFWQDRIVYLPDGVYRVSATLTKRYRNGAFGSGCLLIGQSRDHTIIRLDDNAADFSDAAHPQAVIFTSSKLLDGNPSGGGKDYTRIGEGNDAYENFVENLTIDVGAGNPGAIGIDFHGNNVDAIRNVTLHAPAGSGAIGLSMTRKWPGPTLVSNILIEGFAIGLATAQTEYGLTFEHLHLHGQTQIALRNQQNALAIRDLDLQGPAAIIVNSGDQAFLAIDGGQSTAATPEAFIRNDGYVAMRRLRVGRVETTGILHGANDFRPTSIPDWLPPASDPPTVPDLPPEQWASPARYGATGDAAQDATEALRQTMASGAAVIYLPNGTYMISDALEIPASVRRIVGMNSTLRITPARQPQFQRSAGMLRVAVAGPPLAIERLAFDNSNQGDQLAVELSADRDLILRDVVSAGTTLLDRKASGGRAFLEDVCCGRILLAGTEPVIARQFDTEGGGVRIVNKGAPLSILGLKTEGVSVILDNSAGARSDVFGGLVYLVRDGANATIPAFRNTDSWLAAAFVEESLRADSRYRDYLGPIAGSRGDSVPASNFPARGYGRFVPNLVDQP